MIWWADGTAKVTGIPASVSLPQHLPSSGMGDAEVGIQSQGYGASQMPASRLLGTRCQAAGRAKNVMFSII